MKNSKFTIIAPDTDCGKTYSTAHLLKDALKNGENAIACKPIQTGSDDGRSNDLDFILDFAKISLSNNNIYNKLVCCTLKSPCSPQLAGKIEGKKVDLDAIVENIKAISDEYDSFFVETAGGIYSPLTDDDKTNMDFAKKLGFPVIICIPNRVGAISLSILTIIAAIAEGLKIEGVVFSQTIEPKNEIDEMICRDNIEQLINFTGMKIIKDIKFGEL